jgi:hypothetical protein
MSAITTKDGTRCSLAGIARKELAFGMALMPANPSSAVQDAVFLICWGLRI